MDLSKKDLETELKASEAALEQHKKGALIHEIVIRAFRDELAKKDK